MTIYISAPVFEQILSILCKSQRNLFKNTFVNFNKATFGEK